MRWDASALVRLPKIKQVLAAGSSAQSAARITRFTNYLIARDALLPLLPAKAMGWQNSFYPAITKPVRFSHFSPWRTSQRPNYSRTISSTSTSATSEPRLYLSSPSPLDSIRRCGTISPCRPVRANLVFGHCLLPLHLWVKVAKNWGIVLLIENMLLYSTE